MCRSGATAIASCDLGREHTFIIQGMQYYLSYIIVIHAWFHSCLLAEALNNKAGCFNGCINEVFNNRATSLMGPLI